MAFWILQILFDVLVGVVFFSWLLSRRRVAALETKLADFEARLLSLVPTASVPIAPKIETALGSAVSTLTEKSLMEVPRKASFDAYDKAEVLLNRGFDVREVAHQTGLSVSELRLIGKMNQRQ